MFRYFLLSLVATSAIASETSRSEERALTNCRVTKTNEHRTFSNRCFSSDEVMTGIVSGDPNYIYCARLKVDCTTSSASVQSPEEAVEADGDTGAAR
jgi:hypothetical protein